MIKAEDPGVTRYVLGTCYGYQLSCLSTETESVYLCEALGLSGRTKIDVQVAVRYELQAREARGERLACTIFKKPPPPKRKKQPKWSAGTRQRWLEKKLAKVARQGRA